MAYNTNPIITDKDGNPISQYYNPDTDSYEPVEGGGGGNKVILYNADGTENNSLSLIPILDRLSQLTGTVIDEETRKSNELQRIELYNLILQMLADGELKGDKGDTGKGLQFNWNGTSLGVRIEGDIEYIYVDLKGDKGDSAYQIWLDAGNVGTINDYISSLKGEKGDVGTVENLTKQNVTEALGYIPIKSVNDELPDENGNVEIIVSSDIEIVDNLNETVVGKALDATQGKVLNDNKLNKSGDTIQNYREKLLTLSGLTPDADLSLANVFKITLEGATTLSISNPSIDVSQSLTLIITQPSTARTVIFPSNVKWMNETIPDLSTINKTYYLLFDTIDEGVTWHGRFGGMF